MRKPRIAKDKRRGTYRVEWWVAGPDGDERKQEACGTDYAFAKQLLEVKENLVKRNALGQCDLSRTARECHAKYIEWMEQNGYPQKSMDTSIESCGYYFRRVVTLEDCDAQSLYDWKTHMLSKDARIIPEGASEKFKLAIRAKGPLAPNTIRRRLIDVRTWLSWAKANKWIDEKPIDIIKEEQMRTKGRGAFIPPMQRRPRFYTYEELDAYDKAVSVEPEFQAMSRLASRGGLRTGEIPKIKAEDIGWYIDKNGERAAELRVTSIKGTGVERTRIVPLHRSILEVLPPVKTGFLFPRFLDADGEPNHRMIRFRFDKYKDLAGIAGKGTFYEFRHTFAKVYLEKGLGNLKSLKDIMGHESMAMMDIYASFDGKFLRESIAGMEWGS